MMKKISVLCLIVIMIMTSVVCIPFVYATDDVAVTDSSEVKFLKGIGILDDNLVMDMAVNRGVFATYIARLYGDVPASNAAAQLYFDVKDTDASCSAISLLTQVGLLNGYGDGTFRPERPVTLSEAAKVTVDILGYKYLANINGGYPTGYTIAAQNLGLLKGLDTTQTYFYGDDFAKLLYNAIDVDILKENGIIKKDGETSSNMEKIKGHTILTENLNLYSGKGVVYANTITNLNGASVNKDQIWIDNFAVTVNNAEYFDLVGCPIEYVYYQPEDSDEKTLIYAVLEENSVVTLNKETFLGIDGLKVTYSDENGKVKKSDLESNVKFVYNGDVVAYNSSYVTGFKTGAIKLIDNNKNGQYDVVKIENYTSFVADGVNATTKTVDEGMIVNARSVCLNPDNYTVIQILNADGSEVPFESIVKGTVVSYFENNDKSYIKVYVSKDIADGTIASIGTDGGSAVYEIGGKKYMLPYGYTGDTAEAGDVVTAYLDVFGYIAGITKGIDDGFTAGFLLVGKYDQNGFNTRYGFKIVNSQNKTVTVYAEDKVDYNGVSTKIEDLPTTLPQGVICYKLNEEGAVVAIETSTDDRDNYEDGRLLELCYDSFTYYSGMFDSRMLVDSSTVLFSMPSKVNDKGEEVITEYKESDVNAITLGDIKDRDDYKIKAYILSKDAPRLKAVAIEGEVSSSIPRGENLATIVSSNVTLDEKGVDVYKATVLVEGIEKQLMLAENITEYKQNGSTEVMNRSVLKPGDTFRYGTNSDGEIDKLEMIYTVDRGWLRGVDDVQGPTGNQVSADSVDYGKVIANDGTYIRLLFDSEVYSGFAQEHYALPISHYSKVTVITIGGRGCTVTAGSIRDSAVGDYVINYRWDMAAVGYVIIKDQR